MKDFIIRPNLGRYEVETFVKAWYQVEYYFSDFNLRRDKFLRKEIERYGEWVDIVFLNNFTILKSLRVEPLDLAAMMSSRESEIIEVNDDGTKIRRRTEIPKFNTAFRVDQLKRTVLVQGFSVDTSRHDLQGFFIFDNYFGNIQGIVRRFKKRQLPRNFSLVKSESDGINTPPTYKPIFNGSVFVTFSSRTEAIEFSLKDDVVCGGSPLKMEMQEDFSASKKKKRDVIASKKERAPPSKGSVIKISGSGKDFNRTNIKKRVEKTFPSTAISHIENVDGGTTYMWLKGKGSASKFMKEVEKKQVETFVTNP